MNSNLKNSTILLIEDNLDHAELTKRSFAQLGFSIRIIHLTDGEQAINYLFRKGAYSDPKTSPRPQLILLDIKLPKIDGIEVLKEIKNHTRLALLPTVILTTSETEYDFTLAKKFRVDNYLVKPLDSEKIQKLAKLHNFK